VIFLLADTLHAALAIVRMAEPEGGDHVLEQRPVEHQRG
jgi:hypothetical protein